jgi:hypothetical protein
MSDEPVDKNEPTEDGNEVLVDTGRCRVERHPVLGVVITGDLTSIELDGRGVIIPAR